MEGFRVSGSAQSVGEHTTSAVVQSIFVVIVVEMAQVTPPVGFNLFVLQGMTKKDIGTISRAALPFFMLMVLMVVLLYAFPQIVTFLPEQMKR